MKILRFLLGLILLAFFSWLLYFLVNLEGEEEEYASVYAEKPIQKLNNTAFVDSILNDTLQENVSNIFDFKAIFKDGVLKIYQLDEEKFEHKINLKGFKRVLSSDINLDEKPEFWLFFQQNNSAKFLGFQWEEGKLISLNFPSIKGRQAFGYIGNDSLYLEKGLLVRDFRFANDPFAELSQGFRKCYYAFGKDKSFILKKTIDYEKR